MDKYPSPTCQWFRTKGFYTSGRHEVDLAECSPTAACWCLHTMTVLGPDSILCSPDLCQPDRVCFKGELR